jgi:ubiquinone/menaquinone biosynthesis C-methylase UbiE
MNNFYRKFKVVSHFPFWSSYLNWVYTKAFTDVQHLTNESIDKRDSFKCLLCGVSGEVTANAYLNFIINRNPKANITIIDLGHEQVKNVKELVETKYPKNNIIVKEANALDLGFIKDQSIDWIDTNGFFSFFNHQQLDNLFAEWSRILKPNGFISFRELISSNWFTKLENKIRVWLTKKYMGINLHTHTNKELKQIIDNNQFVSTQDNTPIFFLKRFCLIKRS